MSNEDQVPGMPEEAFTLDEVLSQPALETAPVSEVSAEPARVEVAKEQEVDVVGEEQEQEVTQNKVMKNNAFQAYSTSSPRTSGSPDTISIPPTTSAVLQDRMVNLPNIDMVVGSNQHRWAETLKTSLYHVPMKGMYEDRLSQEGSDFRQNVSVGGQDLRGRAPAFNKKPGTQIAEGERALLQLVTHLGVGGLFRAPLWNSGIWVTFKPATEAELLELNRIISADKIVLGRWSYGLALSNSVVYTLDRIFDFALEHVYNTSVKAEEMPAGTLRDWIAPQDIYSFIWGFLCANYPSGFFYEVGCINDPTKCNHVFQETLNVSKLQWTDTMALTDWQKQHMASMAANVKTVDSLKRYREEMKCMQDKRIILNEGTSHEIAITIKTPTISQYIERGHRWIGGIVESVNMGLSMDETDGRRNELVNKMGKAATLCQYVHFIKSVEYGELTGHDENPDARSITIVEDEISIEKTLATLSSTDSIRDEIIDHILKYINDSTVSVIGVPAYDCPVCGKPQDGEKTYPRHTSIIPLDMIQVFFALLGQRLSRIEIR